MPKHTDLNPLLTYLFLSSAATPKVERMKRARSVTSDTVAADTEDARSVSSSGGARTPARKTPSQVKAENAARKAKVGRFWFGLRSILMCSCFSHQLQS